MRKCVEVVEVWERKCGSVARKCGRAEVGGSTRVRRSEWKCGSVAQNCGSAVVRGSA